MTEERWVWVPFEVDKKYDGFRIDRFLTRRLIGYSRSKIQTILKEARVFKGDRAPDDRRSPPEVWRSPVKANTKVRTAEKIQVAYLRHPEKPLDPQASIPVLHEDDDLIIVNKPADLLSHPTDKIVDHTVLGVLRHARPDLPKLHLLHRLDRETSGVIALAKNPKAARIWTRHMEAHRIQKEYIAVVRGKVSPAEGVINMPIGRQGGSIRVRQWVHVPRAVQAITKYRVDSSYEPGSKDQPGASLSLVHRCVVRVFPETGRLHQIRVHFAAIGHPILGDPLYTGEGEIYKKMVAGTCTEADRASLGFSRVALHAAALTFPHPSTDCITRVDAPLPADISDAIIAS